MSIYIIVDLEATCWDRNENNKKFSEIIEIGAVKIDSNLEIIDEFQSFVKPIYNPQLSDFCKNLTSINQNDVDVAYTFEYVLSNFENFITSNNSSDDVWICSWGFYDKNQLIKEAQEKNYNGSIIQMLNKHISIKHQFADIKNIKKCGMEYALRLLNIPLDGTHHRGIDDAKNITKIFKQIYSQLNFI